ncbi:MAG: hypothetical protein AAF197_03760 [Pseudomonadota bacterium]
MQAQIAQIKYHISSLSPWPFVALFWSGLAGFSIYVRETGTDSWVGEALVARGVDILSLLQVAPNFFICGAVTFTLLFFRYPARLVWSEASLRRQQRSFWLFLGLTTLGLIGLEILQVQSAIPFTFDKRDIFVTLLASFSCVPLFAVMERISFVDANLPFQSHVVNEPV